MVLEKPELHRARAMRLHTVALQPFRRTDVERVHIEAVFREEDGVATVAASYIEHGSGSDPFGFQEVEEEQRCRRWRVLEFLWLAFVIIGFCPNNVRGFGHAIKPGEKWKKGKKIR